METEWKRVIDQPAEHLTITNARSPAGTLTITVTGDLDRETMTKFRRHLAGVVDGHRDGDLDLNLSAVDFCDLAGLRTLQALDQATDGHHQVRITAASPAVDALLQLCRIPTLLAYTPSTSPHEH
ncbi:STAS domain-containing protein [Actinoplanes sp. NPDC051346]|uniref:STAS domain-containing protein n=1 Tax=Actinoplanes sp. NPDC051346 TaxID=3155048 RepID=UPI00342D4CCF